MAREYVSIGPCPTLEDCAQVGSENYHERSRKECNAFVRQLRRAFPDLPDTVSLRVKSNPHDFGSYLDVVATFNDADESACEWAYRLEAECPESWDDEARKELGLSPAN